MGTTTSSTDAPDSLASEINFKYFKKNLNTTLYMQSIQQTHYVMII